jgi:hypothetical protein
MSKWIDKIFGSGEIRQYGEHEYYEYPRNGMSGGPGSYEPSSGSGYVAWRGPSIFEDPYAGMYPSHSGHSGSNSYDDRGHKHEDDRSRDGHRYENHYGGASNSYSAGRRWEEDLPRKEAPPHDYYGRYEDNDSDGEDLARAMQETLSLQYPAPYGTSVIAPPGPVMAATPRSAGMSTCAGCHKQLGFGRFLTCLNQNWHPSCFCCRYCHKSIVDREFSVQGNEPYHRDCYKEVFHPKCEICHDFIPPNSQGLIEYRSHPFWDQKYCPSHERDGRKRCCSCDRIEPVHQQYIALEDGRRLCAECNDSRVKDTMECQPLYREILKFYKSMGMPIAQEVPMLLVERTALNNARELEKDGHTHAPETRGLCLSEEQTITTVLGNHADGYGGYPLHHNTEIRKLTRHCEVTAILVLYGLPRLLTGSILAHELMHAWLRLDGRFPNLDNDIEEGICQVIAHIWLKDELEKMTRKSRSGATHQRLGEFFLHQIETDSSPIYGDGFRAAYAAASAYGLARTLDHLRQTGKILRL